MKRLMADGLAVFILISWLGYGGGVALAQEKPQAPEEKAAEFKSKVNRIWEIPGFQPGDERGFLQGGREPRTLVLGGSTKKQFEKWLRLSPEQQKQLIAKYKILMDMSPEERMELRKNLERFKSLSARQKEVLKSNWQRIRNLSDAQRQAIRNNYRRWQKLSPQERQVLRQKYRRFLRLSPEQRSRVMEQYKKWKGLPEGERQKILQRQRWKRQMLQRNPKAI